ncbi:MAG: Do family serine endopeptidase [Candidatus Andeanibacterium colombiense]|uniref:Probable periplasmic serine endoprotease DegP-like n=1 Tax=Candidatus Andeanibacterium colombiense TaxID=3121345 RepID=A0AAJ5XA55_9SPHN|nr:MAG: Do family serine endopeptidase [Sphingomonadaceae bacterium]
MRYAYGISSALLIGGAAVSLMTGYPAGAQVTRADSASIRPIVPRAGAPASFADLTEQLQPAVVNIAVRQVIEVQNQNPFFRFFGPGGPGGPGDGNGGGNTSQQEVQAAGSGFIISADGYIVTNNHVIAADRKTAAQAITVTLFDGTEYDATLVGRDPQSDIAVLKITPKKPLAHVDFGDSSQARAGDWVIAIGNPFGLGGTVTAGIVSAPHRTTGSGSAYDEYIQTDAAINSGNSGGPMFDMAGNVIGINQMIFSQSGGSIGIGFAIPSEVAKPIVEKLIRGEEITRGYVGAIFEGVDDDLADALGLGHDRGEVVRGLVPGEPAAKGGLQTGDIVLKIAGQDITREHNAASILGNTAPGTKITLNLLREGKPTTLSITVGKRPSEDELAKKTIDTGDGNRLSPDQDSKDASASSSVETLGIKVQTLDTNLARQLTGSPTTQGVVVLEVDPGSNAAARSVDRGLVIQSVNYETVTTASEFAAKVAAAKAAGRPSVLLSVLGPRGQRADITVRFKLQTQPAG